MKSLKLLGMVAIGIGLFAVQPLSANDSTQLANFKAKLSQVNLIDLPASASALVSAASDKNRESVTTDAVRAAVEIKSTAAPSVVGAVAHNTPSMAAQAALAATAVQHTQSRQFQAIVKAATAGAPAEAGKIVAALINKYPSKIVEIAIAAGKGAPNAGREILTVVGQAAPTLQPAIKRVLAADSSDSVPVEAALTQSAMIAAQMPQASRTSVAPTPGSVSAPPVFSTLPINLTSFPATNPDGTPVIDPGTGQQEFVTTLSDPQFIQLLADIQTKTVQDPVIIGSGGM